MSRAQRASLNYLKQDKLYDREKPYTVVADIREIPGAQTTNTIQETVREILIEDARGPNTNLSFDQNGFEVVRLDDDSSPDNSNDPEWIKHVYYPFVVKVLQRKLGTEHVLIFEHQVGTRLDD